MLGLKIHNSDSYKLYVKIASILEQPLSQSGQSGLSNTFIIVEPHPETREQTLGYYDEKDFREQFRWLEDPTPDGLRRVERIAPSDQGARFAKENVL